MAVINGYIFRVVARQGLAAAVPTLITGEIGWDTDTKTFRVGDLTPEPPRIMSTKSTGDFDFPTVGSFAAGGVTLSGGLVDGVKVKGMATGKGLYAKKQNGEFIPVSILSGDQSILVVGGTGEDGFIDIRSSASLANIPYASSTEFGLFKFPASPVGRVLSDNNSWVPLPVFPAASNYLHVQNTISATWNITHNLGFKPNISVVDTDGYVIDVSIRHLSTNLAQVTLGTAIAGEAYCS